MADKQPGSSNEASGENQTDDNILQNEHVQKIHMLMYLDKSNAIAEVVSLKVKNRLRQKQIDMLQGLQIQESEAEEIIQQTLLSEQRCLTALQATEHQRSSMASSLNREREAINAKLKSCEKTRSELKYDVGANRAAVDALSKRIYEIKEIATKQAMEYGTLTVRFNNCKSELTAKLDQLVGQNKALGASILEAKDKYKNMTKEHEVKVMELSGKINGMNETCCKLKSDADQFTKMFEKSKLISEQALSNLKQKRVDLEKEMKERHAEQVLAWNNQICLQEEKKLQLENDKRNLEEQERVLMEANERFKEEEEEFKLNSKLQVPKEGTMGADKSQLNRLNLDKSFDLNCLESYHYPNETSLLVSSPSIGKFVQSYNKQKKW